MSAEYRVDFVITRRLDDEEDFTEFGFGSSGAWDSVTQASAIADAMITNGEWETW